MKKGLFSLVLAFAATIGFGQCDPVNSIDENFDGWTEINECWTGVASTGMFLVENDVTFYTFMNPNVSMHLISPEVVEGQYYLTFDFATVSMDGNETEGITVEVGTVSSNENAASFVSISEPIATTVAVQNFSTPVTITAEAKYFAIKVTGAAPHSAAYVDNLVLTSTMAVADLESIKVSAYPNPVVDQLNFTSKEIINEVKIFNTNGQLVQVSKANEAKVVVNVASLKAGIYIARVTTAKGTQTLKVVKK